MLSLFRTLCPYPTVGTSRDLRDGLSFQQPRICKRCKDQNCWDHVLNARDKNPLHFVCPKGMSLVLFQWERGNILANGIIVKQRNTECPMDVRRANQSQKVSWDAVAKWHVNVSGAEQVIDAETEKRTQEAILGLHDVRTAVSLVTRNAEAIINGLPGTTADDKIENADPNLKTLLKSVELLHTRLSMSSIVANPSAATHGKRHPTNVHKLFHRMVKLFEELASRRHVTIRQVGTSWNTPACYDSFERCW